MSNSILCWKCSKCSTFLRDQLHSCTNRPYSRDVLVRGLPQGASSNSGFGTFHQFRSGALRIERQEHTQKKRGIKKLIFQLHWSTRRQMQPVVGGHALDAYVLLTWKIGEHSNNNSVENVRRYCNKKVICCWKHAKTSLVFYVKQDKSETYICFLLSCIIQIISFKRKKTQKTLNLGTAIIYTIHAVLHIRLVD